MTHSKFQNARTPAISGPRPLTKLQQDGGIAGPLHRVVLKGTP